MPNGDRLQGFMNLQVNLPKNDGETYKSPPPHPETKAVEFKLARTSQ